MYPTKKGICYFLSFNGYITTTNFFDIRADQSPWSEYLLGIQWKRFGCLYQSRRRTLLNRRNFYYEQITYSAAAEDGYASSYLSPFDAGLGQTLGQRAIQSSDGTAFTLTSINYNRVDAKVYGMVTFQSGSHALVRVSCWLFHSDVALVQKDVSFLLF